eukprot:11291778-Alexandrium_andersonii.AAC.1
MLSTSVARLLPLCARVRLLLGHPVAARATSAVLALRSLPWAVLSQCGRAQQLPKIFVNSEFGNFAVSRSWQHARGAYRPPAFARRCARTGG